MKGYHLMKASALATGLLALGGCGPATLKPPIPVDVAMAPAVIYVAGCEGSDKGVLGFLGAGDRALGRGICDAMWPALKARVGGDTAHYVLLHAVKSSENGGAFDIEPDLAAEQALGAKYRVVLGAPASHRNYSSDGGGGHYEFVVASMSFRVIDLSNDAIIGTVNLIPVGGGYTAASGLADHIIRGLNGPRCMPLNGWSLKNISLRAPSCASFALRPLGNADEDNGAGKSE